jgi:hypothetical protein
MAIDVTIEPEAQILLQYAGEAVLARTISTLSDEQKNSHIFKQLGEQRYLSSLRAGNIDNTEFTKITFALDPTFLGSKGVIEAAKAGIILQHDLGRPAVAKKICTVMGLPDEHMGGEIGGLPSLRAASS